MGQLAYFIEFLYLTGLWSGWQEASPLSYTSGKAPSKADVLGTLLLSILSGHKRSHMWPPCAATASIRGHLLMSGSRGMRAA